MRSLYAQRIGFSKKGVTTIKDHDDHIIYFITGRWGLVHDTIEVHTVSGELLAEIKQSSLGFFPRFDLYVSGRKVGSFRRYYGVSSEMLFVKGLNWFLIGNLTNFRYRVYAGRDNVMQTGDIEKHGQPYIKFQVQHQADEPLCLCIAAVLDYWATTGKHVHEPQRHVHHARPTFD
ncbi:hypothetical protein LPAF129_04940 [Ligilactobacillus pabuli]|uniref:YxjI n=1 Tax=Ligilactobacillus pabuli TaxID=2886039 RepID=A0ABQ5JFH2_9LACO|nr:hypothetical protein [Ligilactobacillus pabuli]GKS80809.1 hypothetical protein LPAF129_04940 [Ligilactobacillus pabuli]HIW89773.1 hypothetical protein [Candidatus Ligilactobacillus excrementipullorum]